MRWMIVFLSACAATPAGQPQPYIERVAVGSGDTIDEIAVDLTALRSDNGMVRCSLYDAATDFPESQSHVIARAIARPNDHHGRCVFRGVSRAKDYAIVVHHDENNDAVFQKSMLGFPEEGYGFSNDVVPKLSAPSFDDCRFHYDAGTRQVHIAMLY